MDSQSEKAEREESRLQFNKQLFKTYLALDHWHRFRLRLFLEGILVGIAGGLLIALFRFLLGLADTYRRRLFQEIIIPSFGISDFFPKKVKFSKKFGQKSMACLNIAQRNR